MSKDRQRTQSPVLTEVIETRLDVRLDGLHTTMPGKIEKWDPALQKADVKPLLKRPLADEDGNDIDAESLPVIPDVPVRFPRADFAGSKFFMSWPLKKGDLVTLHFTERSLDQWLSKPAGEDVDPLQFRTHDLSDCFAVPGLYPFEEVLADVHPDNLVIGKDGGTQMHFKPNNEIHFSDSGDGEGAEFLALAQKTFDEINALRSAVDALTTTYNGHSVSVTVPALGLLDSLGAPVTGVATGTSVAPGDGVAPPAVNSVASAIVKAD